MGSIVTISRTLTVIVIMGVLASIAIPNLMMSARWARDSRIAGDTERAVTQAVVYAKDKGMYPTSLKVLREAGYAKVPDKDPWGNDYVLSPVLTRGGIPREGDNVYVFSTGPEDTGVYPEPFTHDTGENESIGYSSVHGSWSYSRKNACQKVIDPPLNLLCSDSVRILVVGAGLIILGTLSLLNFVAGRQKAKETGG